VAEKIGALAVGGAIHRVAGVGQRAFELPRETSFVLHHQYAHVVLCHERSASGPERYLNRPFTRGSPPPR
jgi:hypothetical protein